VDIEQEGEAVAGGIVPVLVGMMISACGTRS
jgi:hypothetical protein